jgi:RimJ/RimL family protein N-acetyltransferase
MISYGLETLNLLYIYATVGPKNVASIGIVERCGFYCYQTAPDEHGLETAYYRIDKQEK